MQETKRSWAVGTDGAFRFCCVDCDEYQQTASTGSDPRAFYSSGGEGHLGFVILFGISFPNQLHPAANTMFDLGEHFQQFQNAILAEPTAANWQTVCQLLVDIPKDRLDEVGVFIDFAEENLDHWPPELRRPVTRWTMAKEGDLEVHRLIPDLEGNAIVLPSEVEKFAPDRSSLSATAKIAKPAKWDEFARVRDVFWGVISGSSGEYYVLASIRARKFECNCPSRKRPCKHALALLMMAANCEVFPIRMVPSDHEANATRERYSSTWE